MTASASSANIVNCTPHAINLYDPEGKNIIATFPTSGFVARLETRPQSQIGFIKTETGAEISIFTAQVFGDKVQNLPKCSPGGTFPDIIVSMPVGQHFQQTKTGWEGRVFGPDMGEGAVRELEGPKKGQILGTKRLLQYLPDLSRVSPSSKDETL